MRTRIWPKAAILIVISLYFGLVHAGVVDGPRGGAGRSTEGVRLEAMLRAFYAENLRFGALEPRRYAGVGVVPLILAEVLRHVDRTGSTLERRHARLIAWARDLTLAAGDVDPFTGQQIARQTARLFHRYEVLSASRGNLIMILDRLDAWDESHLSFLARRAGSPLESEADEFGHRSLIVLDQARTASTWPMVTDLRRQTTPYRPAQWALLARSGHVDGDELARLILILAHEFARADGRIELVPELMDDEPLRPVVENFVGNLEDQDELTHQAFFAAQERSEAAGNDESPRVHRRTFFRRLIEGTLFELNDEAGLEIPAAVNANGHPVARRRADYRCEGNLIRARFGPRPDGDAGWGS